MADIDPNIPLSFKPSVPLERPLDQLQKRLTLMELLRKTEEAQRARKMEEQYRSGLRPDMTNEQRLSHALQFVRAKEAAPLLQGEANKKAQIAATREGTLARLQQTAAQFEATHQLRLRGAATAASPPAGPRASSGASRRRRDRRAAASALEIARGVG